MINVFCAIQLVLWVITLIAIYKMDEMIKDQEKLLDLYRQYKENAEESRKNLIQLIDSQNSLINSLKSQVMTYQFLENRRDHEA